MSRSYFNLLRLFGFLPLTVIAAGNQHTTTICERVSVQFPGRISYSGSSVYDASLSSYYTGQERDLIPSCIFTPTKTSEVSQFIKLIVANNNASGQTTKFAIRGGGHTLWTGAANIAGGITIDLRSMNSVVLSSDNKIASLGGGGVWSDIYPQLVPYNVSVVGGRVPGIGVGGFTTGGGINFMSRKHGWGCDNVYGYEVVLASGEVIYATASSHSDLWLALKGGSNNFGIVTRFDVATYPQKLMWGGTVQYNYTQTILDAQAKAFSNFMDPKNFDEAAVMGLILNYENPGGVFSVVDTLFYTEPIVNPPVYQPFTSIPSLSPNSLALNNVGDLVASFGLFLPATLGRGTELVYSFKNSDASLYKKLFQTWEKGTAALAGVEGLQLQFYIQPQPVTNGTNSLGLPPGETDLVMALITAAYDNAADDALAERVIKAMVDEHEKILRKQGLYINFKYLNYADISQDSIGSYGSANKARLQAVSKKYDPHGLFQKVVPGGYKLFK